MGDFIDVWDIETFDEEFTALLHTNAEIVCDYLATEQDIFDERETSGLRIVYRSNPHADGYLGFLESLGRHMEDRTIRAWHYTRLTDSEVDMLRASGIQLSTKETARQRLDEQVATGEISVEIASALFAASPLHDYQQLDARSNRFWLTSDPLNVKDRGVTLLLNNWGGEVVYFWLETPDLQKIVGKIGKSRVLEVAVPLSATRHAYVAAKAMVANFARSIGCVPDFGAFDLCAVRPLGPETVLAIHSEGEAAFERIGRGYPITFRRRSE